MNHALYSLWLNADGWQLAAVLAKTLTYGACFAASGGVFFSFLFRRWSDAADLAGSRRFIGKAALFALMLTAIRIFISSGMLSDDWRGMFDVQILRMQLISSEGTALGLRVLGLLLIWGWVGRRTSDQFTVLVSTGSVLVSASFGLVGHVHELNGLRAVAAQCLIVLHLLAVAFWLGALWPLYQICDESNTLKIARIAVRFGQLAAYVVALLFFAGLSLLWLLLGFSAGAWQSDYAQLMMVKLVAVCMLLGLAALNKWRLTPALQRGESSAVVRLRRSIAAEVVVAGLILLMTACFTTLTGPPMLA